MHDGTNFHGTALSRVSTCACGLSSRISATMQVASSGDLMDCADASSVTTFCESYRVWPIATMAHECRGPKTRPYDGGIAFGSTLQIVARRRATLRPSEGPDPCVDPPPKTNAQLPLLCAPRWLEVVASATVIFISSRDADRPPHFHPDHRHGRKMRRRNASDPSSHKRALSANRARSFDDAQRPCDDPRLCRGPETLCVSSRVSMTPKDA